MSDLHDFIQAKINDVEKAIAFRKQAEATWRSGTDESWKAVGCKDEKKKRLETAAKEGRILLKTLKELEMYRRVLEALPLNQKQ